MFFAWQHPNYKCKLEDILTDIDIGYKLLELHIPSGDQNNIIKTHYENWCSFGMDLFMHNEDEFYETIYEIESTDEIQYLLPYIKYDWIKSIQNVSKKIV